MLYQIELTLEKETENTIHYQEVVGNGKPPIIGSQYVQKWALPTPPPERIFLWITDEPLELEEAK